MISPDILLLGGVFCGCLSGLVGLSVVQVFCFLVDLLSSSILYWKWDILTVCFSVRFGFMYFDALLGVCVCVCVCVYVHTRMHVHSVTRSCPTVCGPMDCSAPTEKWQASRSMRFSKQEYWRGCHFLLQGIFLTPRLNPVLLSLLHCQEDALPLHHLSIIVLSFCCSVTQSCPTLCNPWTAAWSPCYISSNIFCYKISYEYSHSSLSIVGVSWYIFSQFFYLWFWI